MVVGAEEDIFIVVRPERVDHGDGLHRGVHILVEPLCGGVFVRGAGGIPDLVGEHDARGDGAEHGIELGLARQVLCQLIYQKAVACGVFLIEVIDTVARAVKNVNVVSGLFQLAGDVRRAVAAERSGLRRLGVGCDRR